MINFSDPKMLERHGSWMRVQVAFYDFLFVRSSQLCTAHFNKQIKEVFEQGFAEGTSAYERMVQGVLQTWNTPEDAWNDFTAEKDDEVDSQP